MSNMSSTGDDDQAAEAEICVEGETISKTVDGRLRTVKKGINTCKICLADILLEDKDQIAECFIDGRLACQKCRDALNTAFATAQYFVCINVLCRRKWKQLSPRVVSFFCPSCRKCLEAKLRATKAPELQDLSDLAYLQLMYKFWIQVIKVLSEKIPFDWGQKDDVTEFIREDDLQTTLNVFGATFNAFDVPMESCRNWNSMLVRKKYYKGFVEFKDPETRLCQIVPTAELKENFSPIQKTINQKSTGSFFVLDWKDELRIGEEVFFIAFPNPVQEKLKDYVRHIIKVIRGPDSPVSENSDSPQKQAQGAKKANSMGNTAHADTKNIKKNNNKEKGQNNNNSNNGPNTNINSSSQKGGRGKGNQNNQQNYHNQQNLNNMMGTPTHINRSISASSISSLRDLHYMVPAKIDSPYASPLMEPTEPCMTTPVVTSLDLIDQLRTPSYFTPPYRPWKVVPLLGSMSIGDRGNPATIMSSPPPGFNELPGPDGPAASSSNGDGADGEATDGFNDLMQWTDDNVAGDKQQEHWYDPLREREQAPGYRRSTSNIVNFASVPEDQPIDPNFEWPMPRDNSRMNPNADSKRNYVPPQSPWAAYFGD